MDGKLQPNQVGIWSCSLTIERYSHAWSLYLTLSHPSFKFFNNSTLHTTSQTMQGVALLWLQWIIYVGCGLGEASTSSTSVISGEENCPMEERNEERSSSRHRGRCRASF